MTERRRSSRLAACAVMACRGLPGVKLIKTPQLPSFVGGKRMLVIGITGGIASGKSLVAQELGRRGAAGLDADRIGHAVLRRSDVKAALHARWGDSVFVNRAGSDVGEVDRAAVAARVFAPPPDGPRELAYLESLIHPLIEANVVACLERWREEGRVPAAVLDAPVLYKAGWERHCDRILFVDAPLKVRESRAAARGWSREQFRARERHQVALALQRERADVVVDNGGAMATTIRQTDAFWDKLFE